MSAVLPQEGVWRHAETGAVLDLAELWTPGQPNGAKVQNCASVWEFVSTNNQHNVISYNLRHLRRTAATMTAAATRSSSAPSAGSASTPGRR